MITTVIKLVFSSDVLISQRHGLNRIVLGRIAFCPAIDLAPQRGADMREIGKGIDADNGGELDTFPLAELAPLLRLDEINPNRDVK